MHAVLFPSVRLLDVSERLLEEKGTNAHNCSLTSSKVYTTIYQLGRWYSSPINYVLCVISADPSHTVSNTGVY